MCDCVAKFDAAMAEHNARVATALVLSPDIRRMTVKVLVATEKLDAKKRKPVPALPAAYCPFCGTKWDSDGGENGC